MPYTFPFDVPDDLAELDADQLAQLDSDARAHAQDLTGREDASLEAITATGDLLERVNQHTDERAAAQRGKERLTGLVHDRGNDSGGGSNDDSTAANPTAGDDSGGGDSSLTATDGAPGASGTSGTPNLGGLGGRQDPATVVANESAPVHARMKAASGLATASTGGEFQNFTQAVDALQTAFTFPNGTASIPKRPHDKQLSQFPRAESGRNNIRVPATQRDHSGRVHEMTQFNRTPAIRFERDFPASERIHDGDDAYSKLLAMTDEKRLPGGNLMASARKKLADGRGLTAAAGWCAASEVIYDLCELESLDGILDLPQMQASRGGFQIPEDGGTDFSTIFSGIGDAGDTHVSEYDVQNDTQKLCFEIPCPDFVDVRLGADYVCLTASLLQRRGWPEQVARVSRGAMIALAHKINESVIGDIVTAAGAATTIPADPSGDDAAAASLSGVELGITDMKYRHRMPFATTLEVLMPMWGLTAIRAAMARRAGVATLAITDAQILEWFTIRNAVPRFVYDWQDALSGQGTGPGGATSLTSLPGTMNFVVYPAGTFAMAVQDVVSLDTIYDSTGLSTNTYTALFAEDGWALLQMCPDARQYEVTMDTSGCVGCQSGS